MNNQKAQDAYAAAHFEALRWLEEIRTQIEDAPAPDERTNWAHVGDMQHLAFQLKEIAQYE